MLTLTCDIRANERRTCQCDKRHNNVQIIIQIWVRLCSEKSTLENSHQRWRRWKRETQGRRQTNQREKFVFAILICLCKLLNFFCMSFFSVDVRWKCQMLKMMQYGIRFKNVDDISMRAFKRFRKDEIFAVIVMNWQFFVFFTPDAADTNRIFAKCVVSDNVHTSSLSSSPKKKKNVLEIFINFFIDGDDSFLAPHFSVDAATKTSMCIINILAARWARRWAATQGYGENIWNNILLFNSVWAAKLHRQLV